MASLLSYLNGKVDFLHTKCQYLTIFAAFGAVRPYWTVFFQAKELTSKEVGIVYSMQPFLSLFAAPLWAYLADRHNKHKQIFLALIFMTCCFICLFIFLPPKHAVLYGISFGVYSIFMSPMFSFLDAQTLLRLQGNKSLYGRQRLWGAVGWGLASFMSGVLIDEFKSVYAIFFSFFLFMLLFVLLAAFSPWMPPKVTTPKVDDTTTINDDSDKALSATLTSDAALEEPEKLSQGLLGSADAKRTGNFAETLRTHWAAFSPRKALAFVAQNWRMFAFMVSLMVMAWINVLGNFLFMFLRGNLEAPGLVLALAMGITVIMELPFFFYSKNMLHMIGIAGCTIVGHIALITRALSYSFLTNPWWVLPIEITHGIAFSCIWTAGVTYFGQIAPKGREATFQGIFAGIWNVGGGIWSLVGGEIYYRYGPRMVFRFCVGAVTLSLLLYIVSIIGHVPKLAVEVVEIKPAELEEIAATEDDEETEDITPI